MSAYTTKYRLAKPTVGGDADAWGGLLNTDMDGLDVLLGAITTTGSSNAYVVTTGQSLTAYADGQTFTVRASFANTGAATMNVDAIGAKNLRKLVGGTLTALASGDIASGDYLRVTYNSASDVIVIHGLLASMVQAKDATLDALAAMSWTSGTLLVSLTAADTITLQDAATFIRTTGGQTIAQTSAATALTITGGSSGSTLLRVRRTLGSTGIFDVISAGAVIRALWDFETGTAWGIGTDGTSLIISSGASGATPTTERMTVTTSGPAVGGALMAVSGKTAIPIPASAMIANTTNGAASGVTESTTNKVMTRTLDFDQTTQEGAQFEIIMPKSWNESTVTFQPVWTADSGSGGVVWELRGQAQSDDDAIDGSWGTGQTSTDTLLATGDRHYGPESSAITIGGSPAEGDTVVFQIRRNVADASDTLTADARLIGIRLFITTNAANDA